MRRLRRGSHLVQQLPASQLPKMPGLGAAGMACGPQGRAAASSLFPCRLHAAAGGGGDRLSQQGAGLWAADALRRADSGDDRRRPEASWRARRPHRRAAHMGPDAHPSSACPLHHAGWRSVSRRRALGLMQAGLLFARARALASVPQAHDRRPGGRLPARRAAVLQRARRPRAAAGVRPAPRRAATDRLGLYAKPPFGGPEQVLGYLARYTHRAAISNSRLVEITDEHVAFTYKDYRFGGKRKVMRLEVDEFIRRFCCTSFPTAFTASATMASSPGALAAKISSAAASSSTRPRQRRPLRLWGQPRRKPRPLKPPLHKASAQTAAALCAALAMFRLADRALSAAIRHERRHLWRDNSNESARQSG